LSDEFKLAIRRPPVKILHIIDSGGLYGAEVMLLNVMSEQVRLGHEPTLASIGGKRVAEKQLETEAIRKGLNVAKFRMRAGPNFWGAREILRFAVRNGFDILHSHGYKANILFGFLPKSIRRLPLVTTLHGWTSKRRWTKLRLYEWLDARSLNFMDAVVMVSDFMRSHPRLRSLNPAGVHVVHNGILMDGRYGPSDGPAFSDDISPSSGFDASIVNFCASGFTVGSIGRLSFEKGYLNLIRALRLLMDREPDIRLAIIGEGPQRDELEREVRKLGMESRVLLPGYRPDARKYLPFFGVFVLSSLTEGLPMSLLEAMRAGTPIISTRVGGVPEVLREGQAGILVDVPTSEQLAAGIFKLLHDNGLRMQLTGRAQSIVTECYTSRSMAEKYINIYSSLIY
jgi:glycosyltransferase involved in cell wall biosynthesis